MSQKNKLNQTQVKYQQLVKTAKPKPNLFKNSLMALITGGIVCVIGQMLIDGYAHWMKISQQEASNPAVATMIFLGALLTGLGIFDKLAVYAGAGLAVPVTGFANSMVAAALEYKREGLIQGIGSKLFILAGSVITYGVVTAFFVGLIYAVFH